MKKYIIVLLVFALVFTSIAGYAVEEWLVEGSWNHFEDTDNGMLLTSMFLVDDGTVYYVTQIFAEGKPEIGRAFVGSWEFTSSDTIRVIIGENASMDMTYRNYNTLFDNATRDFYFRAELK